MRALYVFLIGVTAVPSPAAAQQPAPVRVVTSLTTYAAIAREIVGDKGVVTAIASGDENPHFVQPKPSFVPLLGGADLFVTTGMDLELWVPALLDKAGNPRVGEGGAGFVAAHDGVPLLDVPTSLSRTQGDIHVFGNPHIWTDPLNAIQIARNILAGLRRVAPAHDAYFTAHEKDFEDRLNRALFGDELVKILGAETLAKLDRDGKLFDFLRAQRYQGAPLIDRLGGWLKQGLAFRGREVVCYHKDWDYFSRQFGMPCFNYIEPKPGIPPTPRHVQEVITAMREKKTPVVLSNTYYDRRQVQEVAQRTGATPVIVPANTGAAAETYIDLVDLWVREISRAFASSGTATQE